MTAPSSNRSFDLFGSRLRATSVVLLCLLARQSGADEDRRGQGLAPDVQAEWNSLSQEISSAGTGGMAKAGFAAQRVANPHALIWTADRDPLDAVLRRTRALAQDLRRGRHPRRLDSLSRELERLSQAAGAAAASVKAGETEARVGLFKQASALRRQIALAGASMDFDTLILVHFVRPSGKVHMCDQYFGWSVRNNGGLIMVTGLRSGQPVARSMLKGPTVENGRLAGQSLDGGAVMQPDLSFDGKEVVFAWGSEQEKCYHIFRMNIDGTGLRQLTDGRSNASQAFMESSQNDFAPCWLPSGRIAFISERRGGYGRCHLRPAPSYTLYSMDRDGGDMFPLSFHETNEWDPSVNNDGMIVYTRWDYIDRDDCIAHHLWTCYPDGRDPRAPHGNYPEPASTLDGKSFADGRFSRPIAEYQIRAIPNSGMYVAVASGHHTHSYGEIIIIDPSVEDDNRTSQIRGVTTGQTRWGDYTEMGGWATPWPLSETQFLCSRQNDVLLVDVYGNREVIYHSSSYVALDPIPARPREKPPVVPTMTWQGERSEESGHFRATISVMDVTIGDMPLPEGTRISAMRIIQVFPKTTQNINSPRLGYASESLGRMVLGTAPVEEDGSVYCEAPVGKEIYFQLLDEDGRAVRSMRAGTYVHPGEQLTCVGCHESKWEAPPARTTPIAIGRPPSPLAPDASGVEPVNFYRLVKPVFDAKCAGCHAQRGKGPNMSYGSLKPYAAWWPGPGNPYVNGDIVTPVHGGSRSIPGRTGSSFAPLTKCLYPEHNGVDLTEDERRRITLWLDCNSNEFGVEQEIEAQRNGAPAVPRIDYDPAGPTGIETDRPLPGAASMPGFARDGQAGRGERPTLLFAQGVLRLSGEGRANGLALYDMRGRQLIAVELSHGETGGAAVRVPARFGSGVAVARLTNNGRTMWQTAVPLAK